jgi:hypothetical protein
MPALSNENSPFARARNDEMTSTPSSIPSFNINNRSSNVSKNSRRSRKDRESNKSTTVKNSIGNTSEVKFNNMKGSDNKAVLGKNRMDNYNYKSIESVTIYKGPARIYSFNTSLNHSPAKHLKHESQENFSSFEKTLVSPKSLYRSTGTMDFKNARSTAVKKPPMIKANSLLPGTNNLMVSQDIQIDSLRNSSTSNFYSPASYSTRNSLVRTKLIESKPKDSQSDQLNLKKGSKTRNLNNGQSAQHSMASLSSLKNPKQNENKVAQTAQKKGKKIILMAKVNLTKGSSEVDIKSKQASKFVNNLFV